jgi:branched-chain amino acid transport system substrate-binding protein
MTRKNSGSKFVVIAVAISLLLVAGMLGAEGQDEATGPIKIGAAFDLSGFQAFGGKPEKLGAELAVEEINANGGLHGRMLQLIVEDDQSKPELSVSKINKLITQDKVVAVVGGTSGDAAVAEGVIAQKNKVPFLTPTGYNRTEAQANNKYSFELVPDYDSCVEILLKYVTEDLGAKKIGFLRLTRLWGVQASEALHELKDKYGVTIVREETLNDTDKDMTPQLTNIMAADPDILFIWAAVPATGIILKNAKQLGIDIPIIGNPIIANKATPAVAGEAADGAIGAATMIWTDPLPRQAAYVENYEKKYDLKPDMWDAAAYDGIYLIAEAIKALPPDKITPQNIRDELEKIKGFEGVGAIYDFTKKHWPGEESWNLMKIEGGKFVRL